MKRFSIITVTYNAEAYLEETLASVDHQSFSNFEHIVWDGGSRDKTLEIVRKFPHILLYQGKDDGIADAMNKGAEKACGEYLIHLHADDLFAHKKVLEFIDTALKQHPEVQWLYGSVGTIDEKGNKKEKESRFTHFDYKKLKKYNCISHPGVCISRRLFWDFRGFDPSLKYAMDYDLWLRIGKKEKPLALFSELAHFREHPQSLSTSLPKKVAEEAYMVRNRYLTSFWEKWISYRTYKRRIKTHAKS